MRMAITGRRDARVEPLTEMMILGGRGREASLCSHE